MNFSYDFEGSSASEFQADSYCDDDEGGWEGVNQGGEKSKWLQSIVSPQN